jgi:tRNA nucleotidyltransferase (CCA-adding enzyme)
MRVTMGFQNSYDRVCRGVDFAPEAVDRMRSVSEDVRRRIDGVLPDFGFAGTRVFAIGSAVRGTFCTVPPDFDFVVSTDPAILAPVAIDFGERVAATIGTRSIVDPNLDVLTTAQESRPHAVTVRKIGVGLVVDLLISAATDSAPALQIAVEVAFLPTTVHERYETAFVGQIRAVPSARRRDVLLKIRVFKQLLFAAEIYGRKNDGIPGHLAEQIVLQTDPAGESPRLDRVMRALAEPAWPDVRHMGHDDGRSMWGLVERYGRGREDQTHDRLNMIADRYLRLSAADADWSIAQLIAE